MLKYSVVVPVYRGEATIELLFLKLAAFFNSLNESFEVVFVYDDGKDNSWQVIQRLVSNNGGIVKGIRLSRNFGQHNATICGFEYATGEFIITIDEDLQQNPDEIFFLIKEQAKGNFDVVYGFFKDRKHSSFRNITSKVLGKLLKVGMPELHPNCSSFRLLKSEVAREACNMRNSYSFLDGYITWITSHVSSVKVTHDESKAGRSSYSTRKLVGHALNIFVTFSFLPIRIVTFLSCFVFIASSGYATYTLLRKLMYNDLVSGFATFAIMGGLGLAFILFSLGVIGEYILRINLKTTQRPNYIAREILTGEGESIS